MQVGFVTQWYDPEVGAAAVSGSIARTLAALGHEVNVLTGFPNYPSGELHPGYRLRPYQHEVREGVIVHRVPLYVSHDKRAIHRSLNYLSFAASSTVIGAPAIRRADVALVYSGPITSAIPAMALRLTRGIPYVLWVQDMWPQSVTASGFLQGAPSRVVEGSLHRLCDAVYRHAARIAVTSPGMVDLVAERGVPRSAISFVPNWADEAQFYPTAASRGTVEELGPFRAFTAMYAGSLGDIQGLETIIGAAEVLRARKDIGFVFVGGGVAEKSLRAAAAFKRLDNVRFLGLQPSNRMAEILALGDVQLVTLRDLPVFRCTLPSKVQTLLAAGRPVIGSVAGDAANVIDWAGGVAVAPSSASDLASAIDRMSRMEASELQRRGRLGAKYYQTNLSRKVGGDRLVDLLQAVRGDR